VTSTYDRASVVLMVLLSVVVALTFTHYGVSWDEPNSIIRGEDCITFFKSCGRERPGAEHDPESGIPLYGGFANTLGEIAARALPHRPYEARHLVLCGFGLLGIVAVWSLARLLAGPAAGFWAALLLAVTPMYYGHMFMNPKDIPYAALHTWSLVLMVRAVEGFPRVAMVRAVLLGVVVGLTAGVRVGGVILLPLYFLLLAGLLAASAAREGGFGGIWRRVLVLVPSTAVVVGTAWAVMCLFWPWALEDPFRRPFAALAFFGQVTLGSPSRWQIPKYLWFQLPELFLLALAIGLALAISLMARRRLSLGDPKLFNWLLVLAVVAYPVLYTAVREPNLYNCMRHFLFVVPPLACAAGAALAAVSASLASRSRALLWVAAVGLGAYLAVHLYTMVRLHPYEYVYYNRFVGGVQGVARWGLETDYWATSCREAVLGLVSHLQTAEGEEFGRTTWRVMTSSPETSATYYFPWNFRLERDPEKADYYVGRCGDLEGREILRVERYGVPFAVALDLRHPRSDPPGGTVVP